MMPRQISARKLRGVLTTALIAPAFMLRAQNPANGGALVTEVKLNGVRAVDADALREGLVTRSSSCKSILYTPVCYFSRSGTFTQREYLDPVEMQRDAIRIRLFYWRRGYRDVEVTVNPRSKGGRVEVAFDVIENEPTRVDTLIVEQADSVLPSGVVRNALTVQGGDPLNMVALDSARVSLRNALWNRGYADAKVEIDTSAVSNETNRGPVTIGVRPGALAIVGNIRIDGNDAINPQTVRRLLRLAPGDAYRREDLLESTRALYLSGLFNSVEITAEPGGDSVKTIVASVREAPLHRLEVTGGVTTADFLQFDAQWRRNHFAGGARRLTVRGIVGNLLARNFNGSAFFYDVTSGARDAEREQFLRPTWSASVEFLQPWAFGPRNQLGASIYTHRRSVPGVVTDVGAGATMAFTHAANVRTSATLGYTFEASAIEASDVYFCVSVGLCVRNAINVVSQRNPLAPISFVASFDNTNDPFEPRHGIRARADLEHASEFTGSDFAFNRIAATASIYRRMTRRSVLAGRLRLGAVRALASSNRLLGVADASGTPVLHPRKFFFAGGSRSVRGYGENQLGPRVLTIDPARLTDTTLAAPCTNASLVDGTCDPNTIGIGAGAFQPRPLGGTRMVEANVELRFPVLASLGLSGAVFVDGAVVGTTRFTALLGSTATITPGFGVRFKTPVGPVRLDLGVRPRVVERLPVITQVTAADSSFQLITLRTSRRFDQAEATGGFLKQIFSRLTLHLAIGPAF